MVQGGTFENDAVLRAMEEYTGRKVTRAPYPGLMGAIGAALLTREQYQKNPGNRTFMDLNELESFSYHQEANAPCPFCANHCKRTILTFSNGNSWITNNRCERGRNPGRSQRHKGEKAAEGYGGAGDFRAESVPGERKAAVSEILLSGTGKDKRYHHRASPRAGILGDDAFLADVSSGARFSGDRL